MGLPARNGRLIQVAGGMAVALVALVIFYLICAKALSVGVGHDEDQFIAPGLLTAKWGLLPWRDYPLFHMPYHVMLVGWISNWTSEPFITYRIIPAFFAWLSLLLIAWQSWIWLDHVPVKTRILIVFSLTMLLLFTPVFYRTIRRGWNHQTPAFLILLAVCFHLRSVQSNREKLLLASGCCLGLAIGMRLTFLPLLAPFGLAIFFLPGLAWNKKLLAALFFSLGALIALAPCLWLAAQAPESAYFSNFRYPKLSLMWRNHPFWSEDIASFVDPVRGYFGYSENDFQGRPFLKKLERMVPETLLPNWQFYATCLAAGILPTIWTMWRSRGKNFTGLFFCLLLPFVFWGSIIPSRVNDQYWYAPLPILGLCIGFGISEMRTRTPIFVGILLIGTLAAVGLNRTAYEEVADKNGILRKTRELESYVSRLQKMAGPGPVLTMKTGIATMAGLDTYPGFAPGEFGWRSAHLLTQEQRLKMKLLCPYDLGFHLAQRPPSAVFLDKNEKDLNGPMIEWAKANAYTAHKFQGPYVIWLPAKPLAPFKTTP